MIAAIKSELLKLLTTRATYGILLFSVGILLLFAFYITGVRGNPLSALNPELLVSNAYSGIQTVALFAALAVMLLIVNEYRHNTIMYTLTAVNRRTKVFIAKVIVGSLFALVFTLLVIVVTPLLTLLGFSIQGVEVAPQSIPYGELVWRALFFGWAYAMFAIIIAVLVRSQVVAIAVLFLFPTTVENLLGLLLKENVVYLPFNALYNVIVTGGQLEPGRAVGIVLTYLAVGGVVSWLALLRRDAN